MKDKDFHKIIDFVYVGAGWLPANKQAQDLTATARQGEIVSFLEVTARDLKRHRAYFSLLNFIWGYMPQRFREAVPQSKFYIFLKHLKGEYDVLFEFKDGTKLVEHESISFAKMSEKRFMDYVLQQLPWIYENVIGAYFKGDTYTAIIDTIEEQYEKFLNNL